MSHPDESALADLALGNPLDDASVEAHVAGCTECADTVAGLRDAALAANHVPDHVDWVAPRAHVWTNITAELELDDPSWGTDAKPAAAEAPESTMSSGTLVAESISRSPGHTSAARSPRRWSRPATWVAAIAASIALGVVGGRLLWPPPPASQVAGSALMTAPLTTPDSHQQLGQAKVVRIDGGVDLRIDTHSLASGPGYLEVWLLNTDGERMVSVGVLPSGGTQSFPVSLDLMNRGYLVVDVSREAFDEQPAHSGDSLLRGKLSA